MDKTELKWEQEEEVEEEEEVLRGRRPRQNKESTTTASNSSSNFTNGSRDESTLIVEEEEEPEALPVSSNASVIGDVDNSGGGGAIEQDGQERLKTCVYFDKTEGIGFTNGYNKIEHSGVECTGSEENSGDGRLDVTSQSIDDIKNLSAGINRQHKENLKGDNLFNSAIRPSEISVEEDNTDYKFSDKKAIESADVDRINESDLEVSELDVETVLEKQNTHDLYCPNCNSCITRRVILRKRKHKIRVPSEDAKRNKSETQLNPKLDAITEYASADQGCSAVDVQLDDGQTLVDDRDREPDIFRCLSCFSFFIPAGSGFKLLQIFGEKTKKDTIQDPQQIRATNKNWFSSIFASSKKDMLIKKGTGHAVNVEENNVGKLIQPSKSYNQNVQAATTRESSSSSQTFVSGELMNSDTSELQIRANNIVPSEARGPTICGEVIANQGGKLDDAIIENRGESAVDHSEVHTVSQSNSTRFYSELLPSRESDFLASTFANRTPVNDKEPAESTILAPQQDGLKLLMSSNMGSLILENLETDKKINVAMQKQSTDDKDTALMLPKPVPVPHKSDRDGKENVSAEIHCENEQNLGDIIQIKSSSANGNVIKNDTDGACPSEVSQLSVIQTKVGIHTEKPLKVDGNTLMPSVQNTLLLQDKRVNVIENLKDVTVKSSADKDTIIVVETGPVVSAAAPMTQNVVLPAESETLQPVMTQTCVVEAGATEAREIHGLDIIKSIVYGGLVELITSLGVVASAAGGDASTLNILALGLANLIGGLLIISHNLWELRSDTIGRASGVMTELVDRYQDLLGQRENFLLHATFAMLSYIVFGLVPPVVYGFSCRESDDRDLKLVTVAVASLLCIIILAIGKAYIQRPPKPYVKTVVYYAIVGLMVSGVSYVVGNLIKKLLEKLGWFHSSSAVTLSHPGLRSTDLTLASY